MFFFDGESGNEFENIKHIHPNNAAEYWFARELQVALDYTKWNNFLDVISRAREACESSGINPSEHFAEVGKMLDLPNGAKRRVIDFALTRYACYLIVQNADPSKEVVAYGQTYP